MIPKLPKHLQFLLDLDGHPDCRLYSVSSMPDLTPIVSGHSVVGKDETITVSVIQITCGARMGSSLGKWIGNTIKRQYNRMSGTITVLNGGMRQSYIEFFDALITSVLIPAFDSTSKGDSYLTVSIQPERVKTIKGPGTIETQNLGIYGPPVLTPWNSGQFTLSIAGLEKECRAVTKISSLSIKQSIKKLYVGQDRFPDIESTKLEEGNLLLTVPASFARGFSDWAMNSLNGSPDTRNGTLRYSSPSSSRALLDLELTGIGIVSSKTTSAKTNAQGPVTFELFYDSMAVR